MKKIFSILAVALLLTPSIADAQLRVTQSGQVRIGNYQIFHEEGVNDTSTATVDSTANLVILPFGNSTRGQSKIRLGATGVSIANETFHPGKLLLNTSEGMIYTNNNNVVFSYSESTATPGEPVIGGLVFNTDITVPTTWTTSDARLKKDISPLDGEGVSLMDLTPVSYRLASGEETSSVRTVTEVESTTQMEKLTVTDSDRTRFGFIAQEVQKLYPELVKEDENGMLAIDYIGFVPLLVDAVKNLTERVKVQDEMLKTLAPATKYRSRGEETDMLTEQSRGIVLYQNRPNPFNVSTEIGCVVPDDVKDACIIIYDMQGKQLRRFPLNSRGEVTLTVDGSTLTPGMYIYTLIADGAEVASKRMIITD